MTPLSFAKKEQYVYPAKTILFNYYTLWSRLEAHASGCRSPKFMSFRLVRNLSGRNPDAHYLRQWQQKNIQILEQIKQPRQL